MGTQGTVSNDTDDLRYEIRLDGELAGFTCYKIAELVMDFDHTEVLEDFKGKGGVGSQVVRAALDDVKARGEYQVKATCPFVVAFMRKHPEYQDLLAEPLPDKEPAE